MKTKTILLSFLLLCPVAAEAADSLVFKLWPNGAPEANGLSGPEQIVAGDRVTNVSEPTLTVYKSFYPNGLAIIACPGGGYVRLAMNHEGHDMAKWMTQMGVTYGVLKYRMPNGHPAVPLDDAMQAMRIMKAHASEWGVTTIGIMGASAGGHLASTLATHYTPDTRPDFQILFYPMISYMGMKGRTAGRPNPLLG
ncbi:MAG: alpha/beta hydrolase, partial [Prevotella sp.]|nr:alpha/beta hydrolase [Prevotella sp.]